jgi:hypothetical protein
VFVCLFLPSPRQNAQVTHQYTVVGGSYLLRLRLCISILHHHVSLPLNVRYCTCIPYVNFHSPSYGKAHVHVTIFFCRYTIFSFVFTSHNFGTGVFFPGSETYNSFPFITEINNKWIYNFTSHTSSWCGTENTGRTS